MGQKSPSMTRKKYGNGLGGRICLLTFHRVVSSQEWVGLPDRGFYLTDQVLENTLLFLKRAGWHVVTVEEALHRMRAGDDGRYANISIDDTYRDTWEQAVPLFHKHDVPVTLFVTSGIPDRTCTLWSTGLETIIAERDDILIEDGTGRRVVSARTWQEKHALFLNVRAAWECRDPVTEYERLCRLNGYQSSALHERHMMNWDMLSTLAKDPYVEIGAHTITHPRVSSIDATAALHELAGSRMRLEQQLGLPVRHFAFPYGRSGDCGSRDFALAKAAGFASAATTCKGVVWTKRGGNTDPYRLPRNTLNGEHRGTFALQAHLTGLSGLAASAMGRR